MKPENREPGIRQKINFKPDTFASPTEKSYWHSAQHIAYRAGCAIEVRDREVFLVLRESEQRQCSLPDALPSARRP